MSQLILASTSASRKELLERLKLDFSCVNPNIDETEHKSKGFAPRDLAQKLSLIKAQAVQSVHPKAIILSGDQVLELEGQTIDKPMNQENAIKQLGLMQAKEHILHTAYTLLCPNQDPIERHVSAYLKMRRLKSDEIERYIQQDNPIYCCGSYKLESLGIALFEKIECIDHTSIVGLPLMLLAHDLRRLGLLIP